LFWAHLSSVNGVGTENGRSTKCFQTQIKLTMTDIIHQLNVVFLMTEWYKFNKQALHFKLAQIFRTQDVIISILPQATIQIIFHTTNIGIHNLSKWFTTSTTTQSIFIQVTLLACGKYLETTQFSPILLTIGMVNGK